MTLGKKYRIQKSVKEHKRKVKKEARKMKALGLTKFKRNKDLGLPNLYPFKLQVYAQLERKKAAQQEEDKLKKLLKKKVVLDVTKIIDTHNQEQEKTQSGQIVEEQTNDVEIQQQQKQDTHQEYSLNNPLQGQKKKYMRELKQVIEASDIILEILDARDPLGCRCKEVEAQILRKDGNKKIILVLNKADLVPVKVAMQWVQYLRREYATVLFKANTQHQNSNFGSSNIHKKTFKTNEDVSEIMLQSSKAIGASELLQLIKNYSKENGVKRTVSVGLVGYPNVGKSSIINSLMKSKATGVSSLPGFTKNLQEVSLDKNVKLIDCPGIIFSDEGEKSLVLRNIIKPENVEDAIAPLEEILKKLDKNVLLKLYKIPDFQNVNQFLASVAVSRGKLMKGGKVDLEAASRLVLTDWNQGKIQFFTLPPAVQADNASILQNIEGDAQMQQE